MLVCVFKVGASYFTILKHLELANKNEKALPTHKTSGKCFPRNLNFPHVFSLFFNVGN